MSPQLLEKAAVDNGFSLDQGTVDGRLIWEAHAAPARLRPTETEPGYGIGSDRFGAMRNLDGQSAKLSTAPPAFPAADRSTSSTVSDLASPPRKPAP